MPIHLFGSGPSDQQPTAIVPSLSDLSRRTFLAVLAAGCASSAVRLPTSRRDEETWALISDTHVCPDQLAVVRGSCMAANLAHVIQDVVTAGVDHMLVNGDVALANGRFQDYTAFRDLVSPLLRTGLPMHFTLGNHDDRSHCMDSLGCRSEHAVDGKVVSELEGSVVRWLMLDSLDKVNEVRGSLGPAQRKWLEQRLDAQPRTPTIVCLHHNLDPLVVGLRDTLQLMAIVLPRRQVKAVMFGHTHVYYIWEQEGLHFINLPAVGYKLQPHAALGWVLAHIKNSEMQLEFRDLNAKDRANGDIRTLTWRSDA